MPATSSHSLRPTADEICTTILFGQDPSTSPLDLAASAADNPRPIMEEQIRAAMVRGPVWVAFSGGRDSSALLAIAAHVAQREGLPAPVPATLAFPEVSSTDEEGWQRLVLEHLGLLDCWVRLTPGDELDMIGPYAQRVLTRHGLMTPPNSHAMLPVFDAMGPGGTLLSGSGGDELMEGRPQRVSSALLSRRRVTRGELAGCLIDDLPRPLLARAVRGRFGQMGSFPWLMPATRSRLLDAEIDERVAAPVRFDHLLVRAFSDRHFQAGRFAYEQLAAEAGSSVLVPFVEREVVGAFARSWGYRFPGARVRSLRRIVGDLLPEAVLTRVSKAEFVNVFATERLHDWVDAWDGSGVDPDRVRVDVLRAVWAEPEPHYCSLLLLQQAWLAAQHG